MKRLYALITALTVLIGFTMVGCAGPKPANKTERIDNVSRVFYHEWSHYTLMVIDPETRQATMKTFRCNVTIIVDAPSGEPMWAVYDPGGWYNDLGTWRPSNPQLKIHISSSSAVEGGGWDHGKFGSGTTTVVR